MKKIVDIISEMNILDDNVFLYGDYMAKLDLSLIKNSDSNLILVTSINPTPFGEGKTTTVIGLNDALCSIGKRSIAVLREPSMGPVFGSKGGATGGGCATVVPEMDINLHFTGDFHAITSCNNLLCAVIDNHIFQGNSLGIDPDKVLISRCIDMNDRALRDITLNCSNYSRKTSFVITAASSIMAIVCLATDYDDLVKRLEKLCVAYTYLQKPIYAGDLGCVNSMALLLKNAIKPNLVQTLEGNPVLIHGGPFANIAHGCNSVISTKMGMSLADYTIVEAGFGSDLGAQKFFDIVSKRNNINPKLVVLNVTLRALKYNGGCSKENIYESNNECLNDGFNILDVHISNMQSYIDNVLVVLNKFDTDDDSEILLLEQHCLSKGIPFAINDSFSFGSKGSIDFAYKVVELCNRECKVKYLYDDDLSLFDKIDIICKKIYHSKSVSYSELAIEKLNEYVNMNLNFDICVAKTQYSLSDDSKLIGVTSSDSVYVTDVSLNTGANFVIVYMGNIMTMPGLGKTPNLLTIKES